MFLLANHGVLAVDETAMEAVSKTLSLEVLRETVVIGRVIHASGAPN